MHILKTAAFAAALAFTAAGAAQADLLVFDDFESYGAASVLNFTGFANLTVTDGSVDYVHEPDFGLSTPYGTGLVDLDGSTGDGGFLRTANFAFNAGDTLIIEVDVAGNRRGGPSDPWEFGFSFTPGADLASFFLSTNGVSGGVGGPSMNTSRLFAPITTASADPWTRYRITAVAAEAGSFSGFIGTTSADNLGVLVDNFSLSRFAPTGGGVPEPASWALMIAGFGLAGASLRRRRTLTA